MLNETLLKASNAYKTGRFAEAFSLYKELASGGHAESQVFVGWMLLEGRGVTPDSNEAASWFERAASLGSSHGAFYFARYLTSKGRHIEALPWYRKSAAAGYLPSVFWVGYALAEGKGASPDIPEAYKFLTHAAKQGHVYAQRQLAILDMRGHRGFIWRLLGIVLFIVAVLKGAVSDSGSEKLRG